MSKSKLIASCVLGCVGLIMGGALFVSGSAEIANASANINANVNVNSSVGAVADTSASPLTNSTAMKAQPANQTPVFETVMASKSSPAMKDTGKVTLKTAKDLGLPRIGMVIDPERTAIVITDPQNDFLSPDGVAWGVVGESVTENKTVENLEKLFGVGKEMNIPVFVSPHYYFPHDHKWRFEGSLETLMHKIHMFDRKGELSVAGFEGSGADWLEQYKPYIMGDNVIVTSPHKVYGPETNDLVLQLRKRGIGKVVLAGMSANLCTESHMRELVEQGFQVTVAMDATAGAKTPAGDGYQAALANFHYIASAVVSTDAAVAGLRKAFAQKMESH